MSAESSPPGAARAAMKLLAETGWENPSAAAVVAGNEPILPSRFPLASAAASVLGAAGIALAEAWRERTGRVQQVTVDLDRAGAALVSFRLQRLNGLPTPGPGDGHPLVGLYQCRDARWIAIHGGFASLEATTLKVLGCALDRFAVARVIAAGDSADWEARFAEARMCCVVVRSAPEWRTHEQGRLLCAARCVEIAKIGESDPVPWPAGDRPLDGIRVLDMTRVLAGPSCGKFLASAGAQVLSIHCPRLPNVAAYLLENGHGKRSAIIDLERPEDAATLRKLAAHADVAVESYRTGSLERRGFGPAELASRRPGLIYVSVNCYGPTGPWRGRPGWELLAQSAVGLAVGHGTVERPALIRGYPCDYLTGYLAGLGVVVALLRRAREGGSYHVRASLCRTGMYVESFGPSLSIANGGESSAMTHVDGSAPVQQQFEHFCREGDSAYGRVRYFPPAIGLSETPLDWPHLAVKPGTHPAAWI